MSEELKNVGDEELLAHFRMTQDIQDELGCAAELLSRLQQRAELREALKAVLRSTDCTHVHTQDCTKANCEFYVARAALGGKE